jgi:hypothetical protein
MSFSGFNLGSSNTPRYGSGVNFDGIDTGATFYGQQPINKAGKYAFIGSDLYKNADPETRRLIAENELGNKSQSDVAQLLAFAREAKDPAARKQALEDTLAFQNAQQASAAPYNMLYKGLDTLSKLPEQISGRAADRAMNIVLGARNATEAYNQAVANYPKSNFQSTASPVQRNYFT